MRLFKTPKQDKRGEASRDAIIDIVASQEAKQEVIDEAKEVSQKLNNLLVENGFTFKIYLATGGHPKHKPTKAP